MLKLIPAAAIASEVAQMANSHQLAAKNTSPTYDAAIQAMVGLMSINGDADRPGVRLGVPVCLGTDGFSHTMWEEWKTAYLLHKVWRRDPRRMNGMDVVAMAVYQNAALAGQFVSVARWPGGRMAQFGLRFSWWLTAISQQLSAISCQLSALSS